MKLENEDSPVFLTIQGVASHEGQALNEPFQKRIEQAGGEAGGLEPPFPARLPRNGV